MSGLGSAIQSCWAASMAPMTVPARTRTSRSSRGAVQAFGEQVGEHVRGGEHVVQRAGPDLGDGVAQAGSFRVSAWSAAGIWIWRRATAVRKACKIGRSGGWARKAAASSGS